MAALPPGVAPLGYLNQKLMDKKCQIIPDPDRAPIVKKMFEKVAYEKWSGRKVDQWLRFELNFKSAGNKHVALGNIFRTLQNPIYYGTFEYPRKSGNWYQGKHEPIVSKELFEKVQQQLKRDNIQRQSHEFIFTKLMTCGLCGSGISAEEKYKQLKNATVAKYIYYGCGRSKDRSCKSQYMREEELTDQLLKLMDKIDFNQTGVQMKFEEELKRQNRFQKGVLGIQNPSKKHEDIDLKSYAKYILKDGTNEEKRELMGCFKSRITVTRDIYNDPERFDMVKRMWQLMLTGTITLAQLHRTVSTEWKFKTRTTKRYIGKPMCKAAIYRMFSNRFYCGYFETKRGNGDWQKGKHEPMITEKEFEQVQKFIKKGYQPKPKRQEFAFTGMMKCAECGAMITAEIKFKNQKNGNKHEYVYYHCTKRVNPNCTERALRLENLEGQIDEAIQKITIPDSFIAWGLKHLNEYRKTEVASNEVTLANKQHRLAECIKQVESLSIRYTSPANLSGELISDEEYKDLKSTLIKEKNALESDLGAFGRDIEDAIERSEKTFNFVRYAQYWFKNGDLNTKRSILVCIGSNLSVSDRTIRIELKKPFKFILESNIADEAPKSLVHTAKKSMLASQNVISDSRLLPMRKWLDAFRTVDWRDVRRNLEFSGLNKSFYVPSL